MVRAGDSIEDYKRQIGNLQETLREKNLSLDGLHYVWCDGGCPTGIHRYGEHAEITEELVVLAEGNVKRLRAWWENKQHHEKMGHYNYERGNDGTNKVSRH